MNVQNEQTPDGPTTVPGWPEESMLEAAWGIIANVDDGNGMGASGVEHSHQTQAWREAACRWRDAYHDALKVEREEQDPDFERKMWTDFQERLSVVRKNLEGSVPAGELDALAQLGKRVEVIAMARVVRWLRDTGLALARQEDPGNPVMDRFDREVANLLRTLEG